ncbi:sugar ABC transporter ATP-binding protein [Ensifer soli]|uniref:sugar ABC transporter ATP-binding protein n=1 Tax=Ciceribacter sp. sgz301302 TaxID=3342379 RepID=UPI0035B7D157
MTRVESSPSAARHQPLVRLEGIGKSFPGTVALEGITLEIFPGEVLAIVGENGAGKSTLIKILTGAHVPTTGDIHVEGHVVTLPTPAKAQALGLNAVHQEVVLCPHLTVAENIYLGIEKTGRGVLDKPWMQAQSQALLDELGFDIDASVELGSLSIGRQQLVAAARAKIRASRLIIFDEPTAYLTRQETERLFSLIRSLRDTGVAVLYISHRMEEIFELCDRACVLRDGRLISTRWITETNQEQLIRDMVNRDLGDVHYKEAIDRGDVLLEVRNLSGAGFEDMNLTVHRGEVVGLFGLIGAGRSEFVQTVFGRHAASTGTMTLQGREYAPKNVAHAIRRGMALIPESRKIQGLCLNQTVEFNLGLNAFRRLTRRWLVSNVLMRATADRMVALLDIHPPDPTIEVGNLSGGNQQKVVIGRWMNHGAEVFIFDEPTVGVDVKTKRQIYLLLAGLLKKGAGVILISSYLPEVYDLSDRLIVMYRGKTRRVFDRPREVAHDVVLAAALGE